MNLCLIALVIFLPCVVICGNISFSFLFFKVVLFLIFLCNLIFFLLYLKAENELLVVTVATEQTDGYLRYERAVKMFKLDYKVIIYLFFCLPNMKKRRVSYFLFKIKFNLKKIKDLWHGREVEWW